MKVYKVWFRHGTKEIYDWQEIDVDPENCPDKIVEIVGPKGYKIWTLKPREE